MLDKEKLNKEFNEEHNKANRQKFFKYYDSQEQQIIKREFYKFCEMRAKNVLLFKFLDYDYIHKLNTIEKKIRKWYKPTPEGTDI